MGDTIYVSQVHHHAWANLTLLDACMDLSDEQQALIVDGTYGSIPATWVHIVATQQRYLTAFTGESAESYMWENRDPFIGFPALRERLIAADEALLDIAQTVAPDSLVANVWRGAAFELQAEVFQIQALVHAAEHRQQIKVTLTQTGIQPPELDMWGYSQNANAES